MPEVKDIITGEVISKQPYTEEGAEDSAAIADSNPSWEVDYNYPSSDASARNVNTDFDTYMGGGQIHDVTEKLGMYKKGGKVEDEEKEPITKVKHIKVPVYAKTDLSKAMPGVDKVISGGLTKAKEIAEDVKKKGKQVVVKAKEKGKQVVAEVKEKRKARKEKRQTKREERKVARTKRREERKVSRMKKVEEVKQKVKSKVKGVKEELKSYKEKHSPRKKAEAPKTDAPKKKVMGEVSPDKKKKAKPKFMGREYDTGRKK